MPRRPRPSGAGRPGPGPRPVGWGRYERASDGEWHVHQVPGAAATKPYRCPGCEQLLVPGTPHVVAWRGDGLGALGAGDAVDARRHWHRACWAARGRRRPG